MGEHNKLGADMAEVEVHGRMIQDICHGRAKEAGWWDDLGTGALFSTQQIRAMVPQKLLLIHSEISEATEGDRTDAMSMKLEGVSLMEEELADAVIRIFDLGGALGFDLGRTIARKIGYNAKRPDHSREARKASGGKRY